MKRLALLILLLLVSGVPLHAQIAFDAISNSSGSDTSSVTSVTWSHTVSSNTNGVIAVGCGAVEDFVPTVTITGITYNSVALTFVRSEGNIGSNTEAWYLKAPATGAHDIVVSYSGLMVKGGVCGAVSLTGVDQTTPVDAHAGGDDNDFGDGPPIDLDITTVTDGAWIVDVMSINRSDRTITMDTQTNRTQRWNTADLDDSVKGAGSTWGPVSTGAHNVLWSTDLGVNWSVSAVSFKPAATAPIRRRSVIF